MTERPDLVVHVGLGASSTLLDAALPLLVPALTLQGVRTTGPGSVPTVDGAPLLVTAPAPPAPSDASDVWAFCSLQLDEVAAVIERAGARRARILLCPERQDRLLERAYRGAVAEGYVGRLDERFPRAAEPVLDYRVPASELRALPGVRDLRVLPIEFVAAGQLAYVGALLGALELAEPPDLRALATWKVPREYGPRGVRIALAMAAHLDTDDERAHVRDYVLKTFSVPVGASPQMLPAGRRPEIVAAYRPANADFFAEFAPDLAPTSYAGRAGLEALGSTLAPVDVRSVARPTTRSAVRSRLRRVKHRLRRRAGS